MTFVRAAAPVILLETISKKKAYCLLILVYLCVGLGFLITTIDQIDGSQATLLGTEPKFNISSNKALPNVWNSTAVANLSKSFPRGLIVTLLSDGGGSDASKGMTQLSNNTSNNSWMYVSGHIILYGLPVNHNPKEPQLPWAISTDVLLVNRVAICNETLSSRAPRQC